MVIASSSEVLNHVIASIGSGGATAKALALEKLTALGQPQLALLGSWFAGAQHSSKPQFRNAVVLVIACDHEIAAPGVLLGEHHPTLLAAKQILTGSAAVNSLTRSCSATTIVVDTGMETATTLPGLVGMRGADQRCTAFTVEQPAMTVPAAILAMEAGIALAMSLGDDGTRIVGIGNLGLGGAETSVAIAAALGVSFELNAVDHDLRSFAELGRAAANHWLFGSLIEVIAHFGERDLAVTTGLILGLAAQNIAVVVDDHIAVVAAALAQRFTTGVASYVLAAHQGRAASPALLAAGGFTLASPTAIGNGEGAACAIAMTLIKSASELLSLA